MRFLLPAMMNETTLNMIILWCNGGLAFTHFCETLDRSRFPLSYQKMTKNVDSFPFSKSVHNFFYY